MPNLKDLPMADIAEATKQMLLRDGYKALQYGNGKGLPQLAEQLTEVMAYEGIEADSANILITTGSQQAVDLITEIMINPGDVVVCEAPSYLGSWVFSAPMRLR